MQKIVVLGAGKSSAALIHHLAINSSDFNFTLVVADGNESNLNEKTGPYPNIQAFKADLGDLLVLEDLIKSSNIVVSLLPPFMHVTAGKLCLKHKKHLLTASYVSDEMQLLDGEAKVNNLTFIMECGLDPGIDHMSAMKIFDELKLQGAIINSFRSYCGGLIAPESDDNPWGYKITWNPRNVVLAGKGTAQYLQDTEMKFVPYYQLFERTVPLLFDSYGEYEAYPNRDSLHYIKTYGLEGIETFIRGTIRKKGFCEAWNYVVKLGLTDDSVKFSVHEKLRIRDFVKMFLPHNSGYLKYLNIPPNSPVRDKLEWLGLNSEEIIKISGEVSPADCLQALIEDKWKLKDQDKDLVLMQHIVDYTLEGKKYKLTSSLEVKGENQVQTAMAKTVGLPLAISTILLLVKKIENKGVIIPVIKEIYNPVLKELHNNSLIFREYTYS